jgi:acetyl esterase
MPLEPQTKALMDQMNAAGGPKIEQLAPADARKVMGQGFIAPPEFVESVKVENRTIPGPAGEIPIRIYTPDGIGPFGVLVFLHGGGWVICDLDTHDAPARYLCKHGNCVVVSVDYRLAPEHKFPAGVDDCWAALNWAASNAASIGGDGARIAVGGDSAGGNLACVMAQMARQNGGPALKFQLLIYPATEAELDTFSHRNFRDYFLTAESIKWFWGHYLSGPADKRDPRVSPGLTKDLKGLPPALVITAEFDPLRDEGESYGARLRAAGVPVTVTRYDGTVHGFISMFYVLDRGKRALEQCAAALKEAIGT